MYIGGWRCVLKGIVGRALIELGEENGTVTRRTAKPWTSVRFRSLPRFKSPGGGIGRRYGLKIRCPKGRAGSSPALGTKKYWLFY